MAHFILGLANCNFDFIVVDILGCRHRDLDAVLGEEGLFESTALRCGLPLALFYGRLRLGVRKTSFGGLISQLSLSRLVR